MSWEMVTFPYELTRACMPPHEGCTCLCPRHENLPWPHDEDPVLLLVTVSQRFDPGDRDVGYPAGWDVCFEYAIGPDGDPFYLTYLEQEEIKQQQKETLAA